MTFKSERCEVCGGKVTVMAFKNTGVCCELCRKQRDGEITAKQAKRIRKGNYLATTRITASNPELGPSSTEHRE